MDGQDSRRDDSLHYYRLSFQNCVKDHGPVSFFGNSQRIHKSNEPHRGPLSAEAEFISAMNRKEFKIEIL